MTLHLSLHSLHFSVEKYAFEEEEDELLLLLRLLILEFGLRCNTSRICLDFNLIRL